ncbi:hypothetical protein [Pseudolabrys sp. Root1462]|uniref:hypothetical protein n=1 Tax=Pseudolabrys sp. Root1462 TaxID=1736466 RepID=UPI00138F04BF|nr:hypothetical protein [Pseudolabrys sp. Root1462]
MKTISPERAAELVKAGATLIDIRETNEYAGENIPARAITPCRRSDRIRCCAPAIRC